MRARLFLFLVLVAACGDGVIVVGGNDGGPELCDPAIVDDGDACTEDSCDPLTGETAHVLIDPDDGDDCTRDLCDPICGVYYIHAAACHFADGGVVYYDGGPPPCAP